MHSAPTSISAAIGRDHEFSEIKITNLPWSAKNKIFFVVHYLLILKVLHMIIELLSTTLLLSTLKDRLVIF